MVVKLHHITFLALVFVAVHGTKDKDQYGSMAVDATGRFSQQVSEANAQSAQAENCGKCVCTKCDQDCYKKWTEAYEVADAAKQVITKDKDWAFGCMQTVVKEAGARWKKRLYMDVGGSQVGRCDEKEFVDHVIECDKKEFDDKVIEYVRLEKYDSFWKFAYRVYVKVKKTCQLTINIFDKNNFSEPHSLGIKMTGREHYVDFNSDNPTIKWIDED